jgi:endoglucanase
LRPETSDSSRDAPLQGVNLGAWLVAGATSDHLEDFVTPADFARLASWRFTHARLPVDDALLETAEGWLTLDRALVTCLGAGLRCVLTLRLDPAAGAGLFATEAGWGHLVARWETIAGRYADAPPLLYYDLLDHPAAPDDLPPEALDALGAARLSRVDARRPAGPGVTGGRAWSALAFKLTRAIRARDERHTIVVESNGAAPGAFAHLRPTRDPNTVYSFHCFEPRAFVEQGTLERPPTPGATPLTYPGTIEGERWDRGRLQTHFEPALDFGRVYQAPLYLGAFGVASGAPGAPDTGRLTWLRTVLSLCRANGVGWAYWTYRDGPFALLDSHGLDYERLGVLQSEA